MRSSIDLFCSFVAYQTYLPQNMIEYKSTSKGHDSLLWR